MAFTLSTVKSARLYAVCIAILFASGCASNRVSSNVDGSAPAGASTAPVLITEDGLAGRKYTNLGKVEVSIKKLTVFNSNPTKEQANEALMQKARVLGADAVINVKYDFGVGATTWGYMDATGQAVKFQQ